MCLRPERKLVLPHKICLHGTEGSGFTPKSFEIIQRYPFWILPCVLGGNG